MILTIYIIILIYFLLGGIGFYFINRKKGKEEAHNNRVKYITYFFIINILFLSIAFFRPVFVILGILIIIAGVWEVVKLFLQSGYSRKVFFSYYIMLFLVLCVAFYHFIKLEKGIVLFTFLVVCIFDAFSQISGQLAGRKKLFPSISPGKTFEGLAGGAVIALGSSLLLRGLVELQTMETVLLACGIIIFAFTGDLLTSLYKRRYKVKDFSTLIPGHGGVMDRFDSFIAGGAFVAIFDLLLY